MCGDDDKSDNSVEASSSDETAGEDETEDDEDYNNWDSDPEDFPSDAYDDYLVCYCSRTLHRHTSKLLLNSSLQNLCLNVLIENLRPKSCGDDGSEPELFKVEKGVLEKLPLTVKKMMLKKLEVANYGVNVFDLISRERIVHLIGCLFSPDVNEFNIEWRGHAMPSQDKKLHDLIYNFLVSEPRPNLRRLTHSKPGCNLIREMSIERMATITHLKNLQHLQLHRNILSEANLRLLCTTLEELQHLSCEIHNLEPAKLAEAIEPAKNLEVFIFNLLGYVADDEKYYWVNPSGHMGISLKNFPNLKVIGTRTDRDTYHQEGVGALTFHKLDKNDLKNGEPRKLQHLAVDKPLTPYQAQRLPNVTALRVFLTDDLNRSVSTLLEFPNLQSLIWYEQNIHDKKPLLQMLRTYGTRLKSFTLKMLCSGTHPGISMDEIHTLCPNLQSFGFCFNFTLDLVNNCLHSSFLPTLTKITITNWDYSWRIQLLFQLLSLPKLECLHLWKIKMLSSTLEKAVEDREPKDVSPSLVELRGSACFQQQWMDEHGVDTETLANQWSLFIQVVCTHAPALKILDFDFGKPSENPWSLHIFHQRVRFL